MLLPFANVNYDWLHAKPHPLETSIVTVKLGTNKTARALVTFGCRASVVRLPVLRTEGVLGSKAVSSSGDLMQDPTPQLDYDHDSVLFNGIVELFELI